MKKVNEINERRKLKEDLACEKLTHISDILEYKFGIQNTPAINEKQYDIFIEDEDEGICFQHTYNIDEIVACNVDFEIYRLKKDLSICISLETFKALEEGMAEI